MGRLVALALFVVFTLPIEAQMRSAGRGVPAPGGAFGARSVNIHRGPVLGFHGQRGFAPRHFPGPFFPGPFLGGRFHHHRGFFFAGSFGFPWFGYSAWYGSPRFYSSYGYPVMAYPYPATGYSYPPLDTSYALNSSYFANAEDQRRIENKLDQLEERVNRFLDEQYEKSRAAPAAGGESVVAPSPATILVFRDKHSEEVKNYAVVGETLWVLDEQKARKISLADLDLTATAKQNEERGVNFRV